MAKRMNKDQLDNLRTRGRYHAPRTAQPAPAKELVDNGFICTVCKLRGFNNEVYHAPTCSKPRGYVRD